MRKLTTSLLTTIFCGGYGVLCLAILINIIAAIAQSQYAKFIAILIGSAIIGRLVLRPLLLRALNHATQTHIVRDMWRANAYIILILATLWIPWTPQIINMLLIVGAITVAIRIFFVQMKMPS